MNKEYREIKFRAWSENSKMMIPHERLEIGIKNINKTGQSYNSHLHYMQWTGLKDKNNKDIYEGDWCSAEFRTKDGIQVIQGKIIMDEYMWCIDCTGCVGNDIFSINRPYDFEVIGNIYQNPELLNTKQ